MPARTPGDPAQPSRWAGSPREQSEAELLRYGSLARGTGAALELARAADRRLRTDPLVRVRADLGLHTVAVAVDEYGSGLRDVDRDAVLLAAAVALIAPEQVTASRAEATARQAVAYALLQAVPDLPRRVGDPAPVAAQFIATLDALGFEVHRKQEEQP